MTENAIYRRQSKFDGMDVSEAKRLRDLDAEHTRSKHLLGEAELDKAALNALIEVNR